MKLIFAFLLLAISCVSTPKAFLSSEDTHKIEMEECNQVLDPYLLNTDIPFIKTGITGNHQGIYFIFANEKEGILVHLVNPGYDWTATANFGNSKYLGYCRSTKHSQYFLIYEQHVKLEGRRNDS